MSEAVQLLRQVRLALQNHDYPEAIRCLEKAADIARSLGDTGAEGRHLGNLALIYYRLGQPDKALDYFEMALARARADHDRVTEDGLLGNMGNILREMERYDDALSYLNQALLIAQEIGDVRGRGIWLGNLGLVYDDLKQPQKAIELHEQAAQIARELQDRRGLVTRVTNLAASHIAYGDFHSGLQHYQEAAVLCADLGDTPALIGRLCMIGDMQVDIARMMPEATTYLNLALDAYRQALDATAGLNDGTPQGIEQMRFNQAEILTHIGNILGEMAQYERAAECFEVAARFFSGLGMQEQSVEAQRRLQLAQSYR